MPRSREDRRLRLPNREGPDGARFVEPHVVSRPRAGKARYPSSRVPIVTFIIGVVMLIGGIVLTFTASTIVSWEPKSKVLAAGIPLMASAGWASREESFVDNVLTLDPVRRNYEYCLGYVDPRWDIVVTGAAIEQSFPPSRFNFYVFDKENFELWEAGENYEVYYKAEGATSLNFTFTVPGGGLPIIFYDIDNLRIFCDIDNIDNLTVPSVIKFYVLTMRTLYFVVEGEGELMIHVTARSSWVERIPDSERRRTFATTGASVIEGAKDFVLKGSVSEATNQKFNFVLSSVNYDWSWDLGGRLYIASCTVLLEEENITSTSFSIPLTEGQASSILCLVVENPLLDTDVNATVLATLEWREKVVVFGGREAALLAGLGSVVMVLSGVAAPVFKRMREGPPDGHFKLWWAMAIITYGIGDLITSHWAFQAGFVEANPIAALFGNIPAMFFFKVTMLIGLFLLSYALANHRVACLLVPITTTIVGLISTANNILIG